MERPSRATMHEHLDAIEYFHIILDRHDVIDAEGALCDTFWEAIDHVAPSAGRGAEIHGAILPASMCPARQLPEAS